MSQRGGFEVVFSLGVFLAILDIGDQRPGFFFWWLVEIDESALFLVVVVGGEFGCGGGYWPMAWWWQGGHFDVVVLAMVGVWVCSR